MDTVEATGTCRKHQRCVRGISDTFRAMGAHCPGIAFHIHLVRVVGEMVVALRAHRAQLVCDEKAKGGSYFEADYIISYIRSPVIKSTYKPASRPVN